MEKNINEILLQMIISNYNWPLKSPFGKTTPPREFLHICEYIKFRTHFGTIKYEHTHKQHIYQRGHCKFFSLSEMQNKLTVIF